MFQALGTHGPEVSPAMGLALDVLLLGAAFWLLAGPNRRTVHDIVLMGALVVSVSLLRVVMQPLPNIQPVTVACLLVGAQLGARRGAAFAVMVTMLSNFFMGDGWWTIFQAVGWATVAVLVRESHWLSTGFTTPLVHALQQSLLPLCSELSPRCQSLMGT
jgi:energy-coupling factor transport system substrate-specific component